MGITILQIAELAGVSIATVSNALNQTKYVNPILAEHIKMIAAENGYVWAKKLKNGKLRSGKKSEIALVVPGAGSGFYAQVIAVISKYAVEEGYMLAVHLSNNNMEQEKHILNEVMMGRKTAGIILSPVCEKQETYAKLMNSKFPLVCLERTLVDSDVDSVLSDNEQGVYLGTEHLIKCGHENIALLLESKFYSTVGERKKGYIKALQKYGISYREELVMCLELNNKKKALAELRGLIESRRMTAVFAGGNTLTLWLIKLVNELGLNCPDDLSIVGFGDDDWCGLARPSLTMLKQSTDSIGKLSVEKLVEYMNANESVPSIKKIRIPMELRIRNSTQNIARGPFGEKAAHPEELVFSEEDAKQLREGDYKVAISFHYSGDEWTRLHERAIVDTLNSYGIRVLSVADAHFDPKLQQTQLDVLMMQKPDAVIAVPTDEKRTATKFKELSQKTKLILINSMPDGFEQKDYACWISVNERENGQNAAKILGNYFEGKEKVKIGLLCHGASYFATSQRDFFAEQTICDNYSNLEIVGKENFYTIGNAYIACKKIMREHPDIQGLYISWERPALEAVRALEDMEIEDVVISTTDLDYEVASYMARGKMIIGLSSQRPYEQGVAVAIATAKALLNKCVNKCIGVSPYIVERGKLEKAWKELTKSKMPDLTKKIYENH